MKIIGILVLVGFVVFLVAGTRHGESGGKLSESFMTIGWGLFLLGSLGLAGWAAIA